MLGARPPGGAWETDAMRIATWSVNSIKARLEKVLWWIERAAPDVLLSVLARC
jgi:hypothetical protein